jgi:lipopolysaccharide biosynthesis glycosyltransferase
MNMKQYDFFTVLNSAYMPFGKIWINSLTQNISKDKVGTIYILDTGLNNNDIEYLKSFSQVEIIMSDLCETATSDAVDKNSTWLKHVLRKTKYFKKILKQNDKPLIMVDADCMFLTDFFDYIDDTKDILVCNRSYRDHDNWIASFFVAKNTPAAYEFMNLWTKRMRRLMRESPERGWFESHSLNLCVNEIKEEKADNILIGDVFTKNVACEEISFFDGDTSIIHFKGTSNKTDFRGRISRFNRVLDHKHLKVIYE